MWLDSFSGDYYVPNYWGGGVTMRVFAPDGTKVFETGNAAPGWQWVVESAQAGVYRVVVDPHDNEAGTVTLRAKDVSDRQVEIPLDGSADRGGVGPAGERLVQCDWSSGGERVRVWLDSFSGDYYVPNYWGGGVTMRVFAPDGTKVFETGNAAPGWQWVVESAQAGVYRVVVDPHDNEAGTVTLRAKDVSDRQVEIPLDGSATAVALDRQENASFNVTGLPVGSGCGCGWTASVVTTTSRTTGVVGSRCGSLLPMGRRSSRPVTRRRAGSGWWSRLRPVSTGVVVDPHDNEAGTVTLRAKDVSDRQVEIPLDGSATAVALDRQENASFNVTASGGERVRVWLDSFVVVTTTSRTTGVVGSRCGSLPPDGTKVFETGNAAPGWQWVVESAQAGVYLMALTEIPQ